MKHIILAAVGVLFISSSAQAQTAAETIEMAVDASPARFGGDAMIIRWNPDHTYETISEGNNGLVCYDRSDERDRAAFAAQCTSVNNLDRLTQNRRFRAQTTDNAGERALIDAAEAAGTRVLPEYGSIWFRMDGADRESALLHATVAMPGATGASTGFAETRTPAGVWLMDAGTSAAHLMILGR